MNGFNLKTAIAIGRQLRPYKVQTSGKIQHAIVNWAEIAVYAQQSKDSVKLGVDRVIKSLSDLARRVSTFSDPRVKSSRSRFPALEPFSPKAIVLQFSFRTPW